MKKYRTINLSLLFLFLGILFASPLARAEENQDKTKLDWNASYKEQIEADGYKYTYEAVPDPDQDQDDSERIRYVGKITVQDEHNNIIYQKITYLEPVIDYEEFPRLSKWPVKKTNASNNSPKEEHWLVAIRGTDSVQHEALQIFFRDSSNELRTTTLDCWYTIPNLQPTEDGGGYTAKVYQRIFFEKVAVGFQECLTVYRLQVFDPINDHSFFEFIPVFGPEMAKPYREYYLESKAWVKQHSIIPFSGELLSGLIGTQDNQFICKEIKALKREGLTDDDLLTVLEQLKDIGYPEFKLSNCKVK